MATSKDFSVAEHDWHSDDYVEWWIERDAGRETTRRQRLRMMLALAPFAPDASVTVLDVGGGYGVLSEEVIRAFPQARVTLQDYSRQMLDAARPRLAFAANRVTFIESDLRDPAWADGANGPFDLVVSSIAIHNLRDLSQIGACYRAILPLLKPDAGFLNYDIFDRAGGGALHQKMLADAGFARVECLWQEPPAAILASYAP
jgi:trans-aconitate methyltransferase